MSTQGAVGLVESYSLIHDGACALETGRDVVLVRGRDARSWLQGQLSQDLEPLAPGESAETLALSPQGKVEAYCRATVLAEDVILLDTESGRGEALFERLRRFRLRVKAELELGALGCVDDPRPGLVGRPRPGRSPCRGARRQRGRGGARRTLGRRRPGRLARLRRLRPARSGRGVRTGGRWTYPPVTPRPSRRRASKPVCRRWVASSRKRRSRRRQAASSSTR